MQKKTRPEKQTSKQCAVSKMLLEMTGRHGRIQGRKEEHYSVAVKPRYQPTYNKKSKGS